VWEPRADVSITVLPIEAAGPVIEIRGLLKRFGKVVAVDDVSFSVDRGRITGFVGPNGAGKTTTLRALLGLIRPTAGTATVFGRPYRDLADAVRHVGAVLEASAFHPGRSGRNHLAVYASAAGVPLDRVEELLELVGLKDAAKRRVGGYSLGMKQRLGLATALLGEPRLLVLDEPANGLDPEGMRWLRTLLRGYAADGGTVLVSSHVLSELAQIADDVAIIARGKLIAYAPLDELTARAGARARVRSPQVERLRAALAARGLEAVPSGDQALAVGASPEQIGEIAAADGIVLHELAAEETSLEEAFLELTGGEARPG
jgi:ABC-2 type transport system ATP-binding protein